MKKFLFIFMFLFSIGLHLYSKSLPHSFVQITSGVDSAKKYDFANNQIKYHGNILGKFTLTDTKSEEKGNKETHFFKITLYGLNGNKVADYDLTIFENSKKGLITVVNVSLKTVKDNVKHDGANFINYSLVNRGLNESDKKTNMLQLNNLLEYLVNYKYF